MRIFSGLNFHKDFLSLSVWDDSIFICCPFSIYLHSFRPILQRPILRDASFHRPILFAYIQSLSCASRFPLYLFHGFDFSFHIYYCKSCAWIKLNSLNKSSNVRIDISTSWNRKSNGLGKFNLNSPPILIHSVYRYPIQLWIYSIHNDFG